MHINVRVLIKILGVLTLIEGLFNAALCCLGTAFPGGRQLLRSLLSAFFVFASVLLF